MSQAGIIAVVIAVVVAAGVGVYVWLLLRKRRAVAAMTPEERELREASRRYEEAVALAEKTVRTTTDAWTKPVKAAEDALADARNIGSRPLGSFDKIRLFEDHIETPQGAVRFENGVVEATVDTARNLVGSKAGVVSRAEEEVFQELVSRSKGPEGAQMPYLLVETPIFVALVDLAGDDEARARQFALSVNGAAGSVGKHQSIREQAVAHAQADLDRVRTDRDAAVAAARTELEAVTADTRRLDAARKAVEEAGPRAAPPA